MKEKIKKINDFVWEIPKDARKGMNVNARLIASKDIIDISEDEAFNQLTNVAMLPGAVNPVWGMPDIHIGYGLPMGAVGAFDYEKGVISAGMTGFDINCGVRLIRTNLTRDDVDKKKNELVKVLFKNVPCGVGSKGKLRLNYNQLDDVLVLGARWALENGYATEKDIEHIEENGMMKGADPKKVSNFAKKRGLPQLGTLGAGNHYLEIQYVDEIFDDNVAKSFGLEKDQAVVMLHCGSRGFGHQVATDYLKIHAEAVKKYKIKLPDQQLVCAPANSKEGQDYFSAMKCAVNYAFANRTIMTKWVRDSFESVFGSDWESLGMNLVYDVAHNICKLEEHVVDGEKRKLYVHRKGATRALPKGHELLPSAYMDVGQPVLIGGSMGTASYILVGSENAKETFYSTCHGAGRAMSRHKAIDSFRGTEIIKELSKKGIASQSTHPRIMAEEAPLAYKDIEKVIDSVHNAGISLKVARVKPMGVVKG